MFELLTGHSVTEPYATETNYEHSFCDLDLWAVIFVYDTIYPSQLKNIPAK